MKLRPDQFIIEWKDRGLDSTSAPDPRFPEGIALDVSGDSYAVCTVELPYPPPKEKRCGFYLVRCKLCDFSIIVTTAGRVDDPRSIKLPCIIRPGGTTQ